MMPLQIEWVMITLAQMQLLESVAMLKDGRGIPPCAKPSMM